MQKLCIFLLACLTTFSAVANNLKSEKPNPTPLELGEASEWVKKLDSTEMAIDYMAGTISIKEANAIISIANGYKFISKEQCNFILDNLWGNYSDDRIIGMIVPGNFQVNNLEGSLAYLISYDSLGYIITENNPAFSPENLLTTLNKTLSSNNNQNNNNTPNLVSINWAAEPYFDPINKILSWAKELKISGNEINTINYEVRKLGRNGVLGLNAITTKDNFEEIKKELPYLIEMIQFKEDYKYEDHLESEEISTITLNDLITGNNNIHQSSNKPILRYWKFFLILFCLAAYFGWKGLEAKKNQIQTVSQ